MWKFSEVFQKVEEWAGKSSPFTKGVHWCKTSDSISPIVIFKSHSYSLQSRSIFTHLQIPCLSIQHIKSEKNQLQITNGGKTYQMAKLKWRPFEILDEMQTTTNRGKKKLKSRTYRLKLIDIKGTIPHWTTVKLMHWFGLYIQSLW
jgi:hypothetical protein